MAEEKATRNVYSVLAEVQHRVTCPKGQYNQFGKYKYRSLEDINTALKPICEELKCGYFFEDSIIPQRVDAGSDPTMDKAVGNDAFRWYLRAKVTFWAEDCDHTVSTSAYAREPWAKKGMDEAQITGMASSYARKYAVCGLFAIDSGEDPDQMDNRDSGNRTQGQHRPAQRSKAAKPSPTPKSAPQGPQNASQEVTDETLGRMMDLMAEFAQLKGKTADEVVRALNKTKALQNLGAREDTVTYTEQQALAACGILQSWISKSK